MKAIAFIFGKGNKLVVNLTNQERKNKLEKLPTHNQIALVVRWSVKQLCSKCPVIPENFNNRPKKVEEELKEQR